MRTKRSPKRFGNTLRRAAVFALALLISVPSGPSRAAAKVEFDEKWEELYVETSDLDAIFDQPYAKFVSSVSNIEDYYLSFTSEDLKESFSAALTKGKVKHTADTIAPFKASLMQYLYDSDDDEKQVYKGITVYIPLPSDAQEHPTDCSLYKLSGSNATFVKTNQCVDDSDVYYVQLTYSSQSDYSTVYGFVYNSPDEYNEEPEDDETEYEDDETDEFDIPEDETPIGDGSVDTPAKKNSAADKNDVDYDDDEGGDYPDDPITEFDVPEDESKAGDDDDDEPEPTKAPTKTPVATLAPTKAPDNSGKSGADNVKDHIPKTGDDFPYYELISACALSALILVVAVIKKKH